MFIHIGGDIIVRDKEVIAILDVNHIKRNRKKKYNFIVEVEKTHEVVKIVNEDLKSLIITKDKVYYSPISSTTLKKRANFI